jgi:hypothetical protein
MIAAGIKMIAAGSRMIVLMTTEVFISRCMCIMPLKSGACFNVYNTYIFKYSVSD